MSGLVTIYVKRIRKGVMTIEQVPDLWREQVRQALEEG